MFIIIIELLQGCNFNSIVYNYIDPYNFIIAWNSNAYNYKCGSYSIAYNYLDPYNFIIYMEF